MAWRILRRRDFTLLLGATLCTGAFEIRAQPSGGRRRLGVLMNLASDDAEGQARVGALRGALAELGWNQGSNLQIDYRWGSSDAKLYLRHAAELVELAPDVLVAGGGQVIKPLLQATRTIPIVFTNTNDPLSLGYITSLSRPGGNITGFINLDTGISPKWLELLKKIDPTITRAAILWDSTFASGKKQFSEISDSAPQLQMQLTSVEIRRDPGSIEDAIRAFSREGKGGLVITASTLATLYRGRVISLAAQYGLPAVYSNRLYAHAGGLISYGPDFLDQYRRAAGYVDRILKGTKPGDLPVEAPRIYETVLNVKTARQLGLNIPRVVLLQATEIIEQ
jgi:putative ABC transport system substrate-binding protein